jgi:hypothetical protein
MVDVSAARILHIPLSGRDRRHYAAELRKAEVKLPKGWPHLFWNFVN